MDEQGRDGGGHTAGSSRRPLVALAGGNFTQLGIRLLLGALIPFILIRFDTTKSTLGLVLTGMWAAYALCQFPSGVFADQYGERRVIVVGLCSAVVGAMLVAAAPSIPLFGGATILLGSGSGLFYAPASSVASRLYEKRGLALAVISGSGSVAGIVYPAAGSLLGTTFGWRIALGVAGLVSIPAVIATVTHIPADQRTSDRNRGLRELTDFGRFSSVLGRPSLVYTLVLATLVGFVFQAFASFFPTFLVEYRGLDSRIAGLCFAAVYGLSALAQPIAGRASDYFSRDVAIGGCILIAGLGLGVLLAPSGRSGIVLGVGLLGVGISWPGPIQARIMDNLGADERGYGFGLVRTVYLFLGASGSVVVGVLADRWGWILGYGVLVGLLAAALAVLGANRLWSLEL